MARKKYTSSNQPLSDKGLVSTEPEDGSMKIFDFISQFEQGQVDVTDEVSYNLRDVIDENYRLYNSKFQESTDSTGLEKIFLVTRHKSRRSKFTTTSFQSTAAKKIAQIGTTSCEF